MKALTIEEISNLPKQGIAVRSLYVVEINIPRKEVIYMGPCWVKTDNQVLTVLNTENDYYFDVKTSKGYTYTAQNQCFLLDEKTGNAAMFWPDEESCKKEGRVFKTEVLRPSLLDFFNPYDLGKIQEESSGKIAATSEKISQKNPSFSISKLTVEKQTIEEIAQKGTTSGIDDFFVLIISRKGESFFQTGRFLSILDVKDCKDIEIEEDYIAIFKNQKLFRFFPVEEGSFLKLVDNDNLLDLFIFQDESKFETGVIEVAKNFSATAPKELFELADGLKR